MKDEKCCWEGIKYKILRGTRRMGIWPNVVTPFIRIPIILLRYRLQRRTWWSYVASITKNQLQHAYLKPFLNENIKSHNQVGKMWMVCGSSSGDSDERSSPSCLQDKKSLVALSCTLKFHEPTILTLPLQSFVERISTSLWWWKYWFDSKMIIWWLRYLF